MSYERLVGGVVAGVLERFHDVCLVRTPEKSVGSSAVDGHCGQLGIAFFEYLLQVPANRIGFQTLSLGQLKVMQEVITLLVFVPFSVYFMQQPLKLDYVWAGLCLVGAVYFVFRA